MHRKGDQHQEGFHFRGLRLATHPENGPKYSGKKGRADRAVGDRNEDGGCRAVSLALLPFGCEHGALKIGERYSTRSTWCYISRIIGRGVDPKFGR